MAKDTTKHNADTDASALKTPSDLGDNGTAQIAAEINKLVADAFALYLKTKNFHWHMSGPHFRDYHLLLDEHADQIFATTDPLAERVRKLGRRTVHSIGEINGMSRVKNNDADFVSAADMLRELLQDNRDMVTNMRKAHEVCDEHKDVATASLLENYIDDTERRAWFLFEATRDADATGH
ncbi:DNA starvation/stationary phase protection protein [Lichenihabitans sp. PAMC28606]|uniref:Dps family protein n=1 Tax=Lichenihabitans sp. PAMC28606 TaxID=2880932 RepID=UPI001D09D1BC|nr:DNA starvation/stationary phase protection protein [Lichenihabitans sp. PAMC28606]UDL93380.1 DNA starvation/stationary phase protection protein [Lichenihabitans sp. PAMC28606]